jgi:DNA polymerase-4
MERRPRIIVHVDMDAFYAAVEQLDHPEYRGRPVVVGADPNGGRGRGVVSAASYEARKYGIHSAQPISSAYRLCSGAVFLRPRFQRYEELSNRVMKILGEFSPLVEPISIDEAFLDCTGTMRIFGSGKEIATEIRRRINEEVGLTASVGVATSKSVAKIASELGKPDGFCVCQPEGEREFLAGLPLRYLWGAGKRTIEKLERMGFRTIGDVAAQPEDRLVKELGKSGAKLWLLANGIDEREVVPSHKRKSISEEITFKQDTDDMELFEYVIFRIADRLTRRMRRLGIAGRTVTVKIRLEGFMTYTRSKTLPHAVDDMLTVRKEATELFQSFYDGQKRVRLLGVGVSNLEQGQQLDLFADVKNGDDTEHILDMLKKRYGDRITRGAFLQGPSGKDPDTGTAK